MSGPRVVNGLIRIVRICPKLDKFGEIGEIWIELNAASRCGRGYRLIGSGGRVERLIPAEYAGYEARVDAVLRQVQCDLGKPVLTWITPPAGCKLPGYWAVGANCHVRKVRCGVVIKNLELHAPRRGKDAPGRNQSDFELWMSREGLCVLDFKAGGRGLEVLREGGRWYVNRWKAHCAYVNGGYHNG